MASEEAYYQAIMAWKDRDISIWSDPLLTHDPCSGSFARVTHRPWEIIMTFWTSSFQSIWVRYLQWNCKQYWTTLTKFNVDSSNGLVPSGNKSLPESMSTQICRHMASQATMSFNWHLMENAQVNLELYLLHIKLNNCWLDWYLY